MAPVPACCEEDTPKHGLQQSSWPEAREGGLPLARTRLAEPPGLRALSQRAPAPAGPRCSCFPRQQFQDSEIRVLQNQKGSRCQCKTAHPPGGRCQPGVRPAGHAPHCPEQEALLKASHTICLRHEEQGHGSRDLRPPSGSQSPALLGRTQFTVGRGAED